MPNTQQATKLFERLLSNPSYVPEGATTCSSDAMLYQPTLGPNPSILEIEEEISYVNALKDTLNQSYPANAADRAYYEKTLDDLFQLHEQSRQQNHAFEASGSNGAGPAYPSFPESPAGNSSASSDFSRKRSLASMGDFDMLDPKRLSLNASPALTPGTPGTPNSLNGTNFESQVSYNGYNAYDESGNGNASGGPRSLPGLQALHSATPPQLQFQTPRNIAMPIRPSQAGVSHFQQQQFGRTQMARPQVGNAGPSNTQRPMNFSNFGNFIDLTSLDDGPLGQHDTTVDPFPELAFAYQPDGQRPTPADTFGQDFMSEEALSQFLITPTQPSGGYAFGGSGLNVGSLHNPLIVPPVLPTVAGPAHPWAQEDHASLDQELFGDFDMPVMSSEANPEALTKLIENIKPHDEVPPEEREQTPRAMSSQLMEHQKLGLTWLMKMEEGNAKGGILADEMGLGKTVQALALILARPSNDPACKTTLIIAPVALMKQWEKELQRHVKISHRLKVFIYHGHGKNADFNKLRKYDVVLTTFGTLGSEMRSMEKRKDAELTQREQRDPTFVRKGKDKLALIGSECMWYRVIIDEAQCIKNKSTQVSKASNEIMARHRLCMTGTPMMNSIDELYPLIRFLRIKPYNDLARFNWDIAKVS